MKEIKLNEKQQQAAHHFEGPMIVLSVAGSGKTHVLTERIVHLIENHSVHPANLLAITFAKKAAMEMLDRLEMKLNGSSRKLTVCTFHSLGYRILKETGYPAKQFNIIQNGGQMEMFCQAMHKVGVMDDPAELLTKVSMAKSSLILPRDLSKSEDPEEQKIGAVYQEYELMKRRQRQVDYDDLLCLPYRLLSEDPDMLDRYQQRFRFILVDEFQDSSKVMVELVKLLTNEHRNIWACGDDDQVIHEFRGANADVFVNFEQHFNGDLQSVTMNENYRSSKSILNAANKLIACNKTRVKKRMKTSNGDGEPIRVLEAKDELSEAELISEEITRLRDKRVKYSDIAVLARVHRLMPFIEAQFIMCGMPYQTRNGSLFNRQEVKTAFGIMKYLITGEAPRGLDMNRINLLQRDLFPGVHEISLQDAFDIGSCYVMMKSTEADEEDSLAKTYLDAFEQIVNEHIEFAMLQQSIDAVLRDKKKHNGVHLLTIHQSKGLEFDAVIIPGVNEGILPHFNALEKSNIEEERRLMYVAITRAAKHLIITYRKRQGSKSALPSRFIKEMKIESLTA